jgi:hypothetical protein
MVTIVSRTGSKIGSLLTIMALVVLASAGASVSPSHASSAPSWGTIMSVEAKTNVREKRSIDSHLVGSLQPGQRVKADFLKDGWYAVFETTEKVRSEKKALGYVWAPRLSARPPKPADVLADWKEKPTAVMKPAPDAFEVAVHSIRYRGLPDGKEVLFVEFDRFYMPAVYSIEGEKPLIFMDVTRTSSMKKEWSEIRTDGTLIGRIRTHLNPDTGILRITLEMTPGKSYTVNPVVYTAEKVYALEVAGAAPEPVQ